VTTIYVLRCASAEPAALFDALLVRPSRNTVDAAEAALAEVTLLGDTCASALPALALEFLPVDVLVKTVEARVATFGLVTLLTISYLLRKSASRWEKLPRLSCALILLYFYTVSSSQDRVCSQKVGRLLKLG